MKLYTNQSGRNEEVQNIIDRMPTRFGYYITLLIVLIFCLLVFFGWIVRYPDVVIGEITINTNSAPLKIVSNTAGKIKLCNIRSLQDVQPGQIIGFIENPAKLNDVLFLKEMLSSFNPKSNEVVSIINKLSKNLSLGELNNKYSSFINALHEYRNFKHDRSYFKQKEFYSNLLKDHQAAVFVAQHKINISLNNLKHIKKFHTRDSILFSKKVISESELDKSVIELSSAQDSYENALFSSITAKQNSADTKQRIGQLTIEITEKENELKLSIASAYNDIIDNISSWEIKYLFKTPFGGKVQFYKFFRDGDYIQYGEPLFTLVSKQNKVFGQVLLQAKGSGKIKRAQEVIVKLEDYPYEEYGSIKGKVSSISLVPTVAKGDSGNINLYMVNIEFPNQLITNYSRKLNVRTEAKGIAEIIANDRRLIERFFDNMKYALNN